jgi:RHS repeat-associated protein
VGRNQSVSLPAATTLQGSVVDDGLPVGGSLTSSWIQISGPAAATLGTPNLPQTTATFSQPGTYVFQLTGSDSQLSSSATSSVVVYAPNKPPVVNAGPNQTWVWWYGGYGFYQVVPLNGTASDDGLPSGSTLTVNWSTVSGPGTVAFSAANSLSTLASFSVPGQYLLALNASDGQFTSTSTVSINAVGPPSVSISAPSVAVAGTPVTLSSVVTMGGQPLASPIQMQWQNYFPPAPFTFDSPNSTSTTVTFPVAGQYSIRIYVSNPQVGGDTFISQFISVNVVAAGSTGPTVSLIAPNDGTQLTAPTAVTGSVSDGNWTLAYALQDDFNPLQFTTIASGTGAVSNGTLGTFDPTLLLNGSYVIKLTSTNSAGLFSSVSVTVSVARNMKIGVFSLSFNDMTVPVAGIPIQVIRSYDSRDKGLGDFGIGWRLGLSNVRLQKNHNLGLNWQETQTTTGYLPQFCLAPTDNKVVTITFPDGRVFTFQPNGGPCQLAGDISASTLGFTQVPGPSNTAGASLVAADGGQFVVEGSAPGPVTFFGYDGNAYNPTTFILTTAEGTRYTIDQKAGLANVADTNGNMLTFTPNGIISSAGKSVTFARDEQGRITRITDANQNTIQYSYNGNDLVNVADRVANQTQYTYDNKHNMLTIVTPDGKTSLANTFDSTSGRLSTTREGAGGITTFTPNLSTQTEAIKDRNGNTTTYTFDNDGNVTQVLDPLNRLTTSTYDGNDNKLTETNALGKTTTYTYDGKGNRLTETDSLQHSTTYTYNLLNKPLTITDANNHTTTNTYDGNGNLLTTTDPMNGTTTNTYSANGLLASTKDALGRVTLFGYDGYGNLTSQTDANNTMTTYGYDSNGNRTSQSVKRSLPDGTQQTLLTQYLYDATNKLIKTTYPDGAITQIAYNSLGQLASTTDARAKVTSYGYDGDGRVTYVGHSDGTSDQTVYDANGNRTRTLTAVSDGLSGVTTYYHYDALNRLTQTLDQGQVTVLAASSYDAIGQVLTSTDANHNVTTYTYDDAGRRASVKDALQNTTTFAYDGGGNQLSVTDANNNTTLYEYDANNRRIKVKYPDTKFETTAYDALGRVTSRTDANGKTTQYGYDVLGRLTSVTDALNQVTTYAYDEVGNRLTQTDANQHATAYAYDQRGRRLQRTLPLGQSESYTYDANGNMATRTDFNGRTTTYTYDAMNRILSKTADPYFAQNHIGSAQVTYTYDVHGRRGSMTDGLGTTGWSYDDRGRVTGAGGPAGGFGYGYDRAGNLTSISPGSLNYTYDALNRLSTVSAQVGGNRPTVASYGYDNVGNLQSVTYGNGVVHAYGYDARNRLANLGVTKGSTNLFGYGYTVDAAGHRTSVTEQSGRTVNYSYDDLYRLTNETIAGGAGGMNGSVTYSYDAVGNRTQKVSTLPGYPGGLTNYNANDQLATDTYDANGNTTASGSTGYVYDFENHLISANGITYVYDGDGHRVSKTVNGTTTTYATTDINPTGYSQVVGESYSPRVNGGEYQHSYIYGLDAALELRQYFNGVGSILTQQMYFVHDGHGSVRAVTDQNGAVTDTYDYDAFGVLIHQTGTTPNTTLYSGEQFDPDLGLYFNRARYMNVSTGRFWTMDEDEGNDNDPASLHKYLYAGDDPVNQIDPSGHDFDLTSFAISTSIYSVIGAISGVAINGVTNAIQGQPIFQGAGGAAAFGAAALPLSVAFPAVGLVLGGLGIAGSGIAAWNVFTSGSSSAAQKGGAVFLVALSLFGAYGAVSNAAGGSLWVNVKYPTAGSLFATKTGSLSTAIETIRGRVSDFNTAFTGMPTQQQNGITIAVGIAEDSSGSLRTLIGTSEPRGYIRAPMRGLIQSGDIVVKGSGHAEADIVSYSNAQGWKLVGVGATRGVCPSCAAEISAAGADVATPKQ